MSTNAKPVPPPNGTPIKPRIEPLSSIEEAYKHATRGHAVVDDRVIPALGMDTHIVVRIEGREIDVIASCGISGAHDDLESRANAYLIARLWNSIQSPCQREGCLCHA